MLTHKKTLGYHYNNRAHPTSYRSRALSPVHCDARSSDETFYLNCYIDFPHKGLQPLLQAEPLQLYIETEIKSRAKTVNDRKYG